MDFPAVPRGGRPGRTRRAIRTHQKLLIALSGCAILMMLTMGWVKGDRPRFNGYLIYGVMSFEDEGRHYQPAGEKP